MTHQIDIDKTTNKENLDTKLQINQRVYSVLYGWGTVKEISPGNIRVSMEFVKDKVFAPGRLLTVSEALKAGYSI